MRAGSLTDRLAAAAVEGRMAWRRAVQARRPVRDGEGIQSDNADSGGAAVSDFKKERRLS